MSITLERDMSRLTAQSAGQDPKEVIGGAPEYERELLIACAAEMPILSWHCIQAKYNGDQLSERKLLELMHKRSIQRWFTTAANALRQIKAGQLVKVTELAVLAYLYPASDVVQSVVSRAVYVDCGHEKFRSTFQDHYAGLISEMEEWERVGDRVYKIRKYGPRDSAS